MKKQIITIAVAAVLAIALFVGYTILKKSDIDEGTDKTYELTETEKKALGSIGKDISVSLVGYNAEDSNWNVTNLFVESIVNSGDKLTMKSEKASGDFKGVRVSAGSEKIDIAFDSMFLIRYDGAYYAFDPSVVINAILKLDGKKELSANPRALSGYDLDGDNVLVSGRPYVFPQMEREDIYLLTINNSHGQYTIFQDNGKFYFGSSRMIEYDDELFAQVTSHCRHCLSLGKMEMPEGNTWETYGLGGDSEPTAIYSIGTKPDKDGVYIQHTVIVGNISSSGSYYFARYNGGKYKMTEGGEGEESSSELLEEFSKDCIYLIDASNVEGSYMIPQTDIMKPSIMNAISDTNAIYGIDNVELDFYDLGISGVAKNLSNFNPAPNLSAKDPSAISKIIGDKKYSKSNYASYEGGWSNNIDVFAGFSSSDKNATYIEAAIMRKPTEGNYEVKFGLLKAMEDGAFLPNKVTINYSTDGINWHSIENGSVSPSQEDKTIKTYSVSFKSDKNIKFIRVIFDIPQTAGNYVVFDEIRIYVDGLDGQPIEAISGVWRFISPSDYIPDGRNFAHTDITNFGTFVQSLAILEGEKVVDCAFSKEGDASPAFLDKEKLAKYGLDKPARHYSFEYDDVICDFYISAPNEEGIYYAYSTFTAEVDGTVSIVTTDVIVQLTAKNCPWLVWDFDEFLDHSLFSAFTDDCTEMNFTVTENGKTDEYNFDINKNAEGSISAIMLGEKSLDIQSFRYLYQTVLGVYMQDEYVPQEGELAEEWLSIEIKASTEDINLVFYRVSNAKCYFTVNGNGGYYCLSEDVRKVITNLGVYVNGGTLTLYDC